MSEIGKILRARYQVIQKLGTGGFGDTYLANDLDLPDSPLCVVKKIALHLNNSSPEILGTVRRLFTTEAEILHKLGNEHSQIPRLYAYFEENDKFYLVQEFIDGTGLDFELELNHNYNEQQVLILWKEIVEILSFVHNKGVVHRDIKPANLIRRKKDEKLVLIDFGAVKEIGSLNSLYYGQPSLTVAIGSPGYMPSEQAQGRPHFSSDIYAVGMIGIQALTGLLPSQFSFDYETGEIAWREKVTVSDKFADILIKMTRYDFRERYQSAEQLLEDINVLLNHKNVHLLSSKSFTRWESSPPLPEIITSTSSKVKNQNQLPKISIKINSILEFFRELISSIDKRALYTFFIAILLFAGIWSSLNSTLRNKLTSKSIKVIGIVILFGFSTGTGVYGSFLVTNFRNNKNGNQKNKIKNPLNVPYSYGELNEKYENSIEEIKSLYQKAINIQESYIDSLTSIINNHNDQISTLIQNSETKKYSKSDKTYNINGKVNNIHIPEPGGEVDINYSDESRNLKLGGQETTVQKNATINQGDIIDSNDYNEQKGNNNAMNNITQSHSGSGDNVAGDKNTTNVYNSQDLTQAAANIQALLKQLEQTYPTNTTAGKMAIATEAIKIIEQDPKLAPRLLSALKSGGASALDSLLNHPAASFVIAALDDWLTTK